MTLHKLVNGKSIPLTEEEVLEFEAKEAAHALRVKEKAATQYRRDRAKEYPPVEEQLDIIYHKGLDAWKAVIAGIKVKYPKPGS